MIQPMVSFLESAIQYSNDDYIYIVTMIQYGNSGMVGVTGHLTHIPVVSP